ncbi:MAG TPA: glycosyltransferase family 4 protein [Thermodesulfobacteriota bacterium]|nr:glycosyltransferase family 4 protein [Thermodesulfobacteriota bacterium]
MKILFVTLGLPYPPDCGARIHDYNLIKNISGHHSVFLLSLITEEKQVRQVDHLRKLCHYLDFVLANSLSVKEHLFSIAHTILNGRPLATHPFIYDEMMNKISKVIGKYDPDIVQIEHSFLAPYVEAIPTDSRCKKILSFHNLAFNQYKRMFFLKTPIKEKFLFLVKWMLMHGWEARYAQMFDHCLVVSPIEKEALGSANPNVPISIVDNGVDTTLYQPLGEGPQENTLIFVGVMGYPPNIDAVLYFCNSIMPLIQNRIPDLKLVVVGHEPAPEIRELAERGNVTVTGYVENVIPYYQQSQVTIVPLRGGGGTRLKILESMALGRPIVSTTLGCEGLNVTDGENIMISDSPREFSERVIQLLTDKGLRERIARNARRLVETHYDWAVISRKLMKVYENISDYSKVRMLD